MLIDRRRRRLVILGVLGGWGVLLAGCWLVAPPAREAAHTARLLPAFFAGLPVHPEAWGRPDPIAESEPIEVADGQGFLHIYRPPSGRHAAILFSLGVNPAPPDDPRVVRLLAGFARSGYVAVLVQSTALDEDRITPAAPDLLVRAYLRMEGAPYVRADRIAIAGFSVGAGIASVAAADPRIRDRVRLLEAFGGYFSFEELAGEITTSSIETVGPPAAAGPGPLTNNVADGYAVWEPDPLSRAVMRFNLIAAVPEASQREAIALALDGDAGLASGLNTHARAVYDLLANTDPARAAELYARLPQWQRDQLRGLSPSAHVEGILTRVFLMHDRGDPLIPYVQSRRYATALTAEGRPPRYSEFEIFEHVDPTRGGNPAVVARDMVKLFMHIQAVLRRLE